MILFKIQFPALLLSLIILFGQCSDDKSRPKIKRLTKYSLIQNLNPNYSINYKQITDSTEFLSFVYKAPYPINMGHFFHFSTKSPFYLNKISINNIKKQRESTNYFYKLYVNNKYAGKYKTRDTIVLNRKITSIYILFLKTANEHIVEAWKGNTILKLIKQNNKTDRFKPQINLLIYNKQTLKFQSVIYHPKHNKKTTNLNKVFINKHFSNNQLHSTGFYQDKKAAIITQYSLSFNQNGNFQIYQIISKKTDRKLINETFFNGNWSYSKSTKKQENLLLEGTYSGYFADREELIVRNRKIKITSTLNNSVLKSNKLISKIYLDFPNDALVNVKSLIPDIKVDMPYAGTNNFTGIRLYPCNKCFLRYEVANALIDVQNKLKQKQMGLKLFDGYRPFSVQAIMFKKFPIPGYVADSIGGSVHNRGSAVDLTIIDKTGNELDMGTGFDELSRKANHNYLLFPDTILKNRIFLKELMQSCNFTPIHSEWWHYNYIDGRKFPKIDDPFLCD